MNKGITRRSVLAAGGLVIGSGLVPVLAATGEAKKAGFKFCLNGSTISGQKLPLPKQIDVTAKAGYDAYEPWIREIDAYAKAGGSLADLKKHIGDSGLSIEDAIGFSQWIVDDDPARQKGLDQFKREMEMIAQIGCKRVAAPPIGATNQANLSLDKAAERYRALADLGKQFGITPQIETWGHSKVLCHLSDAVTVAEKSGVPNACILSDVFHMYKGGVPFDELKLLKPTMLQMMHMNDYPAEPPREKANDSMRVFPGDGVAPLPEIIRMVAGVNPQAILSLELFNRDYWKMDALECAKRGLEKMKAAVAKAQ